MWCVDPGLLCRQHLLGEHTELHQLVGHIEAGHTNAVEGQARRGQVDTARIVPRHRALVAEMRDRGYNHDSPLEYDDDLDLGGVDEGANREDLAERCEACCERIEAARQ
jgi:hypothetical protein